MRKKKLQWDRMLLSALSYTVLFVFGMACLIPFCIVFASSFTAETALLRDGYGLWPAEFSVDAYKYVFSNPARILWAYGNTIMVTVIGTVLAVAIATMTGYVLARRDFKWHNHFSLFFFFTTLFNGGLVPWYLMCTTYLGFKDNYLARILPLMFSVWNVILAKNYMKGISFEITESGKIDGANDFQIFSKIIFPLTTPLIATLTLFTALAYWNDWYYSMLFISKPHMQSLQYLLQEILASIQAMKQLAASGEMSTISAADIPSASMKMAMTCVTVGPIILLYPFLQRYFIKGMIIGAVKG